MRGTTCSKDGIQIRQGCSYTCRFCFLLAPACASDCPLLARWENMSTNMTATASTAALSAVPALDNSFGAVLIGTFIGLM